MFLLSFALAFALLCSAKDPAHPLSVHEEDTDVSLPTKITPPTWLFLGTLTSWPFFFLLSFFFSLLFFRVLLRSFCP